jgi:hypothetical protein
MDIPSILDTAKFRHLVLEGANEISTAVSSLQGFQIPEYDELALTYYGTTNNIATVAYKKTSSVVATITLTYATQPPTVDDTNLVNITVSYP